jgi:UDP-N-acetylmuramyl pentapeptide phosphotransferase/UDP-N-acetylglucosamine-1-phosphate transferase
MIFLISKYLFFIFFLTISIYFAKKKNIFLNLHHLSSHKNFVENSKNTPVLLGLFFLLGLILFNYINNINLLFLCVVIFILGFFLDLGINISPRWRILSQFFLVLILIIFFNIKIVDLRNDLLNSFLKIKYLSIFFTAFCFLILINGSNFIDGLNTLLLGYYVIIYYIIYFLQIYVGPINVLGILLILSIIFLFNFFGRSFTGDGGSYLISFIS